MERSGVSVPFTHWIFQTGWQSIFHGSRPAGQGLCQSRRSPKRTNEPLGRLLSECEDLRYELEHSQCFVSADPIFEHVTGRGSGSGMAVINGTTAFRPMVAVESLNHSCLLPMNEIEASDVCRAIVQQRFDEDFTPEFPAPITGGRVDRPALELLDNTLDMFRRFVPVGNHTFSCPITFGRGWRNGRP